MSGSKIALAVGTMFVLVSCSPTAPSAMPAPTVAATQPVPAVAEATVAPAALGGWRDLESVNLCSLIHNDEVAELLESEPTRGDLDGATGPNCTYQITPDGGATVENLFVYLYGEDMAEVSLTLARDAGGTLVEGLADEAYLVHEVEEGQYRLIGVRKGDFGFEILSPDDDGAVRLAELILGRL